MMDYKEAIKEAESQVDMYEAFILYNKDFEPKNDNRSYEYKIDFLKTAISAMQELQTIHDNGISLERLKDIDFRKKVVEHINYMDYMDIKDELEEYKQIGAPEEVREALEKAEKYHWHDLRKNPDDIPSGRNMCTCFAEGDFVIEDGSVAHGKYPVIIPFPFSEYEYRYNFKVVAWREIEPFESEVKE